MAIEEVLAMLFGEVRFFLFAKIGAMSNRVLQVFAVMEAIHATLFVM
jgi:hypothetical protein